MENQSQINLKTGKGRLKNISGTWKLEYKTINTIGKSAFGGRTLSAYPHPKTHQNVVRQDPNQKALGYLMVSKLVTLFHPDENPQDLLDVEWMIHHPEVKVEGYKNLPELYKRSKKDNAQLTLIALDYQEVDEIQEEDYIDKLIGKLSLDGGPKSIGIERLRYILAQLDKPYMDARYMDNVTTEKKVLRSKLKSFARSSYANAKAVYEILDNESQAKTTYEIKEMIRLHVVVESNGAYKYNNIPIGVSMTGILRTWENQPELKVEMQNEMIKRQG